MHKDIDEFTTFVCLPDCVGEVLKAIGVRLLPVGLSGHQLPT
jgi:hypothetical protein